ncbi:MAG: hypothetical protein RR636_14605 [Clostridium sp.]|uniref:hypothetical protein n=1 Tax=Clostridium sp. TaxID=1506 RepID=UPI00306CB1D2
MNVWIYISWLFIILAVIYQVKDKNKVKSKFNFLTTLVGLCCIPLTLVLPNKYKLIFSTLILICFIVDLIKFYNKK